ncbi:MAG: YdcF family protein [Lachnospiraceae bacterium]|nr:YdcF family protein [Lachnospiraceae bacterium]
MRISDIDKDHLTDEIIDRVLYEGLEDTGEKADCILVLGSIKASLYRIPVAVKAYQEGRAPKILLSGGAVREFPEGRMIEAEHMYRHAVSSGVLPEDILIDDVSQNTVENMFGSLMVLQRAFRIDRVRRVILVTTTFHMRRSLALARYLFPEHIEVLPCPADDNNTRRENWMNSEEGRKRAEDEVLNILSCVENGLFPDFEI